jgi:hypothetical protein
MSNGDVRFLQRLDGGLFSRAQYQTVFVYAT